MSELILWKSVGLAIDRAVAAAGTLTALLTLAGLGLAALALGPARAPWAALAVFGLAGAAEVLHRQRQAQLVGRCQLPDPSALFFAILSGKQWHPKVLKQLAHGGVHWQVLGFDEANFPLGIGGPQCPTCAEHVLERIHVRFPGRLRIRLACPCGFAKTSPYTVAELRREVAELANLPR